MAFQVLIILCGLVVGWIRRGSLWNMENLNLKLWWLLPIAYLLQHVSINYLSGTWYEAIVILSYVLMLFFCATNLRAPGLAWITAGTVSNFIALGANGLRMPAYVPAVKVMAPQILGQLQSGTYGKSIVMSNSSHLNFLGDIFAFNVYPPSLLSIGDLLFSIGLIILIQQAMISNRKGSTVNV